MFKLKLLFSFTSSSTADTPTEEAAAVHTTGNGVTSEVRFSHKRVSEFTYLFFKIIYLF